MRNGLLLAEFMHEAAAVSRYQIGLRHPGGEDLQKIVNRRPTVGIQSAAAIQKRKKYDISHFLSCITPQLSVYCSP